MNILVVEDEIDLRDILCDSLRMYGATCLEAGNATEAAEVLKTAHIDVILSDIRMPGGDGRQLAQHLKDSKSRVPFFLMTGYSDFSDEEAHAMGALKVFKKPFNFRDIRDCLFSITKQAG